MKKFVLILSLFVLKVSCLNENDWNGMLSSADEKDPSVTDYKECGPGKRCVPPSLCNDGKVNKYGAKLIAPRFDDSQYSDQCEKIDECCITDEIVSQAFIAPPTTQLTCGHRKENGIMLKLKSPKHEAEYGEFPWMVAILRNENDFFCGGSLIHPKIVLTAAHRLKNLKARNIKVRAGEWDRNSESEPLPHEDKRVKKIILHRDFIRDTFENNVALLILQSPFDYSPHIGTVCLPPPDLNFNHADCFVTGWGKASYTSKMYSDILKKIAVRIVPRATCERNLQMTTLGSTFRVRDSYICAGGENGEDACQGDGGSPLVCPIPNTTNRYYQVGLVSAGIGCGQMHVPGIYADTAYLLPWIQEQFRVNNFNLTYLP